MPDIERIIARQDWVCEGIFLWWTEPLLQAAGVIIWLDLPWTLAVWRIVTRHIRLSLAGTNPFPGTRRLLGFLRWTIPYYLARKAKSPRSRHNDGVANRAATAQFLAPYAKKLIHCRTPADVEQLLSNYPPLQK